MIAAVLAFVLSVVSGISLSGLSSMAVTVPFAVIGGFIIYYLDKISKK